MENKKRTLLILTQKVDRNDSDLGFFYEWIKRLADRCDSVIVVCLYKGSYELPANVQVYSLGKETGAPKWLRIMRFFKYVIELRDSYGSVFIHMNPEYVVLGGLLWRAWRKKMLLWYTHKSITWKLRVAEKLVDTIFTASKESFRLQSAKVQVVGHGIDTQLFCPATAPPSADVIKLLTVGRITPSKDLETMIGAVGILSREGAFKFILDIVGEPVTDADRAYCARLKHAIESAYMGQYVNFAGAVPHDIMPKVYKEHHIFVHASRTGSLDKVVLEAMACGLPVITSGEGLDLFPGVKMFKKNDSVSLAQVIKGMSALGAHMYISAEGTRFVQTHHNLNDLVERIIVYFYGAAINSHSHI